MIINLLNDEYKNNEEFYSDFLNGDLRDSGKFIDYDEEVIIEDTSSSFPIYLGKSDTEEKKIEFKKMIKAISDNFLHLNREYFLSEKFWHSYFCIYKRDYILEKYPQIKNSYNEFKNIVIKKFDWENYIYKAVLAAQYVVDNVISESRERYYDLIIENLDVFNYIIKYEIFRNDQFLINFLDIVEETNTSAILKAKIKNRPDLGADERYGRRVIYEFNKSYPIVLSPMMDRYQLREYFIKFLSMYYKQGTSIEYIDEWVEN